jgi:hypothetical protein
MIYCKAIGAKSGTDMWAKCALAVEERRSRDRAALMQMQSAQAAQRAANWDRAAQFLMQAGTPPAGAFSAPPAVPRPMNCSFWRNGVAQCQ